MEVTFLETGRFFADGGAMFGAVPKTAWCRRYPSDEQNGCILAMRSLLIKVGDRLILVDTGAGEKHLKKLAWYRFFGYRDWRELLREQGYASADVTDVVLTHLHFDHCAGCTYRREGSLALTFPQARHWVSRRQWENFKHPHPLEQASFFPEDMFPVEQAGLLHVLDAPAALCPGVWLDQADGHTPGQLVPRLTDDGVCLVFAGDVIPLAASVSPEWISAYDLAPTVSYDAKLRLLDEAARTRRQICFCHDAYTPSAQVRKTAGGLFVLEREQN